MGGVREEGVMVDELAGGQEKNGILRGVGL